VGSQVARSLADQVLGSVRLISLGRLNEVILNRSRLRTMLIGGTLPRTQMAGSSRTAAVYGRVKMWLWPSIAKWRSATTLRRPLAVRSRWGRATTRLLAGIR
jgi:hypothetical protein